MNDSPRTHYDPLLHSLRTKGPRGMDKHYKKFAARFIGEVHEVKPKSERFAPIKNNIIEPIVE